MLNIKVSGSKSLSFDDRLYCGRDKAVKQVKVWVSNKKNT